MCLRAPRASTHPTTILFAPWWCRCCYLLLLFGHLRAIVVAKANHHHHRTSLVPIVKGSASRWLARGGTGGGGMMMGNSNGYNSEYDLYYESYYDLLHPSLAPPHPTTSPPAPSNSHAHFYYYDEDRRPMKRYHSPKTMYKLMKKYGSTFNRNRPSSRPPAAAGPDGKGGKGKGNGKGGEGNVDPRGRHTGDHYLEPGGKGLGKGGGQGGKGNVDDSGKGKGFVVVEGKGGKGMGKGKGMGGKGNTNGKGKGKGGGGKGGGKMKGGGKSMKMMSSYKHYYYVYDDYYHKYHFLQFPSLSPAPSRSGGVTAPTTIPAMVPPVAPPTAPMATPTPAPSMQQQPQPVAPTVGPGMDTQSPTNAPSTLVPAGEETTAAPTTAEPAPTTIAPAATATTPPTTISTAVPTTSTPGTVTPTIAGTAATGAPTAGQTPDGTGDTTTPVPSALGTSGGTSTFAPTPGATEPSLEVAASAFAAQYLLSSDAAEPTEEEFERASEVTLAYLETFFTSIFANDPRTEMSEFVGQVTGAESSLPQARIAYSAQITFTEETTNIPTQDEIDGLMLLAFLPPSVEALINDLNDLSEDNPFSTTEDVNYERDDSAPSTPSPTSSTLPPTTMPAIATTNAPTAGPTVEPAEEGDGVPVTPFTVTYSLTNPEEPSDDHYDEAEAVTLAYLNELLVATFDFVPGTTFVEFRGESTGTQFDPTQISYTGSAIFSEDSDAIPSQEEMDLLMPSAFQQPSVEGLLLTLRNLPATNPFSSTSSVEYTVNEGASASAAEPETSTFLTSKFGLALVAGASTLSLLIGAYLTCQLCISKKRCCSSSSPSASEKKRLVQSFRTMTCSTSSYRGGNSMYRSSSHGRDDDDDCYNETMEIEFEQCDEPGSVGSACDDDTLFQAPFSVVSEDCKR